MSISLQLLNLPTFFFSTCFAIVFWLNLPQLFAVFYIAWNPIFCEIECIKWENIKLFNQFFNDKLWRTYKEFYFIIEAGL